MKLPRWSLWVAASLFVLVLAGCEGGGTTTALGPGSSGVAEDTVTIEDDTADTGMLSLMLTDAPTEALRAVYVTIDSVEVHVGGEEGGYWEVVADPDKTYNLLELVDGVLEHLGTTDLPSGSYTMMRLIIGRTPDDDPNVDGNAHEYANYLLFEGDLTQHKLDVPSGVETGIKLVHGFEIIEGLTLELILDFDARESVVTAGKSGKYLLKPTITVIDTLRSATITGSVNDDSADAIPGVRVTAQTNDGFSPSVESGTHTEDPTGSYTMYVGPGTYCVVAYKPPTAEYGPAYGPRCEPTDLLDYNDIWPQDFTLTAVDTGTIIGNVVTDGTNDVNISFQIVGCGSAPCDLIEIWPLTVAAAAGSYTYTIGLPPGDYEVVADSLGATQTVPATVAAYTETTGVNFNFSP